jgi:hypothetical protein
MKSISLLTLFCTVAHVTIAQYRPPDMPDDNISGQFVMSPLTIQFDGGDDSLMQYGITGVLVSWDEPASNWGDTLLKFTQSATPIFNGWECVETVSIPQNNTIAPVAMKKVYKRNHWAAQLDNLPDSILVYNWSNAAAWQIQRRTLYDRNVSGYLDSKRTFINGSAIADSIEFFEPDLSYGKLTRRRYFYDHQAQSYVPKDSIRYSYFNDTNCVLIVYLDYVNDTFVKSKRYNYYPPGDPDNYELLIDDWFPDINSFSTMNVRAHAFVPSPPTRLVQYETFHEFQFKSTRRENVYYNNQNLPIEALFQYFPQLTPLPDSLIRKEFVYEHGRLKRILVSKKESFFGDWQLKSKWEFSLNTATTTNLAPDVDHSFSLTQQTDGIVRVQNTGAPSLNTTLRVMDINGRILQDFQLDSADFRFSIAQYPAGFYFASLITPAQVKTFVIHRF